MRYDLCMYLPRQQEPKFPAAFKQRERGLVSNPDLKAQPGHDPKSHQAPRQSLWVHRALMENHESSLVSRWSGSEGCSSHAVNPSCSPNEKQWRCLWTPVGKHLEAKSSKNKDLLSKSSGFSSEWLAVRYLCCWICPSLCYSWRNWDRDTEFKERMLIH